MSIIRNTIKDDLRADVLEIYYFALSHFEYRMCLMRSISLDDSKYTLLISEYQDKINKIETFINDNEFVNEEAFSRLFDDVNMIIESFDGSYSLQCKFFMDYMIYIRNNRDILVRKGA